MRLRVVLCTEVDVMLPFLYLYTLLSTIGIDGHSTAAQNCFRWVLPLLFILQACVYMLWTRLISVLDVVISPMNPYQPIPIHILSSAVFQSRILIYAGSCWLEEFKLLQTSKNSQVCSSSLIHITSSWCLVDQLTHPTSTRWFIAASKLFVS